MDDSSIYIYEENEGCSQSLLEIPFNPNKSLLIMDEEDTTDSEYSDDSEPYIDPPLKPLSAKRKEEESDSDNEMPSLLPKILKPTKIVLSAQTKSKLEELQEEIKKQELKAESIKQETKNIETKECETKDIETKDADTPTDKKESIPESKSEKNSEESKVETDEKDHKTVEESSEESELEDDESKPKKQKKEKAPETSEYDPKNVHYEGDVAIYTDPKSGYQYKWCKDTDQWLPKSDITYGFEDDVHTYTDTEGVKYFWDVDRNAWFPKIDDDFMARYQMSYGFVDNTTKEDEKKEGEKKEEEKKEEEVKDVEQKGEQGLKRKIDQPLPSWFDVSDQQNTKVYVNNLPTDITEEEFVDLMQKCGLVMRDLQTGKMKVKLYTVPDTDILKGDALCTYIKIESVELALNLLDGSVYRGKKLQVERAKFEMKGAYNPSLKPKKRKRKDKDKLKKMQEKLFDWRPEKMRGERSKHERVVIVKNLFEPTLFDREVSLILEYQQDLRDECGKCGDVRRVLLYDRHPEGVAQITMKEPEQADEVVNLLNGRWFGQRQITAEIWDGKKKYKIGETDAEISQRIDNWDKFLETDEKADKAKPEEKHADKTETPISDSTK